MSDDNDMSVLREENTLLRSHITRLQRRVKRLEKDSVLSIQERLMSNTSSSIVDVKNEAQASSIDIKTEIKQESELVDQLQGKLRQAELDNRSLKNQLATLRRELEKYKAYKGLYESLSRQYAALKGDHSTEQGHTNLDRCGQFGFVATSLNSTQQAVRQPSFIDDSDSVMSPTDDHSFNIDDTVDNEPTLASTVVNHKRKRHIDPAEQDLSKRLKHTPIEPSRHGRLRRAAATIGETSRRKTSVPIEPFKYKLVTKYVRGEPIMRDSTKVKDMSEILQHVNDMISQVEEVHGAFWTYAGFDTGEKASAKPYCVYSKAHKKYPTWNAGHEGRYACRSCAMRKMPCITYDRDEDEWRLLPLHEKDRWDKLALSEDLGWWVHI